MNPTHETSETIHQGTAERLARRPWPATPIRPGVQVSFEFFPPAKEAGEGILDGCADQLATLDPAFVSVTYGAGGTTQDRTVQTIRRLRNRTDLDIAGHLTCVGATAAEVDRVIDTYLELGVRRVVALRGDVPSGVDGGTVAGGHGSATDLVTAIRNRADAAAEQIDISVAAYPEVHPKAESSQSDLDNLKRKFDAGADRAITQFFFDTDAFLRFLDRARSAGITGEIIPGIMPVTNFARVRSFSERCGTVIPAWMPELFGGLDEMPEVQHLVAATVAAEQCRRLAEHGVNAFHFYTMNRPELSMATCRILGVHPKVQDVDVRQDAAASVS